MAKQLSYVQLFRSFPYSRRALSIRDSRSMAPTHFLLAIGLLGLSGIRSQHLLPACICDNFRNSLNTDHVGDDACSRMEPHGLKGRVMKCSMPERPFIPFVDSGCPVDHSRCKISYTPPVFHQCTTTQCFDFGKKTASNHVCERNDASTCFALNYIEDKKIGGSEYYGCPEDAHKCTTCLTSAFRADFSVDGLLAGSSNVCGGSWSDSNVDSAASLSKYGGVVDTSTSPTGMTLAFASLFCALKTDGTVYKVGPGPRLAAQATEGGGRGGGDMGSRGTKCS